MKATSFGRDSATTSEFFSGFLTDAPARQTQLTPLSGYLPKPEDINVEGLDISLDTMKELLTVDNASWIADLDSIKEFYAKIGDTMPKELLEELAVLEANLKK